MPQVGVDRWGTLLACLTVHSPQKLPLLDQTVKTVLGGPGIAFEVVAGTPAARYGPRITVRPAGDRLALAGAVGLASHPWGPPDWVGLRVGVDGKVAAKAYHRLRRSDPAGSSPGGFAVPGGRFPVPAGLPGGLYPVMAALDGTAVELYLRMAPAGPWTAFVSACTAALGGPGGPCSPHPRPAGRAFCLSLRRDERGLSAVTVYADHRALPGDREIGRAWTEGMDQAERTAYELALAGVRSLGPRPRDGWHAALGWTLERDRGWHRAASLRVPG
jgi:hypothetical protein